MEPWMIVPASVVAMLMVFVFAYSFIRSTSRRENLRSLMRQRNERTEGEDVIDAKLADNDPSSLRSITIIDELISS